MSDIETEYVVYHWEDGEMRFARRVFVCHEPGASVTDEMVRAQVEDDSRFFTPGKYRAIPFARRVDFEVTATVVLS